MPYCRRFKRRNKKIKHHFRIDAKKVSLLNKDFHQILNKRKNQI